MMPENETRPKLEQVLDRAWAGLEAGATQRRHAFHTPALASAADDGPSVRTVVLRHAGRQQRSLICHTDLRSPKIAEFRREPVGAWMFYDRDAKIQIRARGPVTLHHGDELARERWNASREQSRQCYYATRGPGANIDPDEAPARIDDGFAQFVVLRCEIRVLDWLYLRAGGHWRARFDWDDGRWSGRWIAP